MAAATVYVEVRDQNGKRIEAFAVHRPISATGPATHESDHLWTLFEDDGRGNGDGLGEKWDTDSLAEALGNLGEKIVREHF